MVGPLSRTSLFSPIFISALTPGWKLEFFNLVKEYTSPITIDITKFTDDEIKKLIDSSRKLQKKRL